MDPLITPIVVILGKYALDKGVELGKEVGPQALDTAKEMFQLVLDRIGKKKPETAAEFPNEPETYEKPLVSAVEAEVQADPDFAAQLQALLAQYEEAAQQYAAAHGISQTVTQTRDGAIAQGEGATALGAGATQIHVGGSVSGGRPNQSPNESVDQP
jgi:hypothetical protein